MILEKRLGQKKEFCASKKAPKHFKVDLRWIALDQQEKTLAATLGFLMILALIFPRWERDDAVPDFVSNTVFEVSSIPQTRQSGSKRPKPPEMPAVPIEAEIEVIAEDETIASSDFSFSDLPPMPGPPSTGFGAGGISIGPRLVKEVFPMVSDRIKGNGIRGEVDLKVKVSNNGKVVDVELINNTTKSAEIAQAAVEAAFKCVYLPAMKGKRPIAVWTTRKLRIDYTE